MNVDLLKKWQKSNPEPMPEHIKRIHDRLIYEYKHERLGKEAAEKEAKKRNIPEARINAVLWFPIKGFEHEGDPCECKATVWLNEICLGCGAKRGEH